MRDALRKLKPDRFEDIIAMVALYRPGPMDNIPRYINCKHGDEQPDYLHPTLEPILEGDLRHHHLPGAGDADRPGARRLLAGRRRSAAPRHGQEDQGRDGRAARDLHRGRGRARRSPQQAATAIFEQVAKFAGYGFNKAHAAAYALVAYQTAYLKANYPVEFFAASMTLDLANPDKLNVFRQELARVGIALLPPDINHGERELHRRGRAGRRRDPLCAGRDPRRRRAGGRGLPAPHQPPARPHRLGGRHHRGYARRERGLARPSDGHPASLDPLDLANTRRLLPQLDPVRLFEAEAVGAEMLRSRRRVVAEATRPVAPGI